jgi:hypothetical protein
LFQNAGASSGITTVVKLFGMEKDKKKKIDSNEFGRMHLTGVRGSGKILLP